jgi:hypothetical protein
VAGEGRVKGGEILFHGTGSAARRYWEADRSQAAELGPELPHLSAYQCCVARDNAPAIIGSGL